MRNAFVAFVLVATACSSNNAAKETRLNKSSVNTAESALKFIPAETQIVVGIDLVALRASPFYKELEDQLLAATRSLAEHLKMDCIDIKAVQRITVGVTVDPQLHLVVVLQGPGAAAHLECLRAGFVANRVDAKIENGVMVAALHKGAIVETVVAPDVNVIAMGPTASKERLAAIVSGGTRLQASAALVAQAGKIDPHAAVWALANGNVSLWKQFNLDVAAASANLVATDNLSISGRLELKQDDAARSLAKRATDGSGAVKMFFDRLDVKADGVTIHVDAKMNSAQIHQLIRRVLPTTASTSP